MSASQTISSPSREALQQRKFFALMMGLGILLNLSLLYRRFLSHTLQSPGILLMDILSVAFLGMLIYTFTHQDTRRVIPGILLLVAAGFLYLSQTRLLKSQELLQATLENETGVVYLTLRKDHSFELMRVTWAGITDKDEGRYNLRGDRIEFNQRPDSSLLPPEARINQGLILLGEDSTAQIFRIVLDERPTQ
ncbi:MAG: hypothetical protein SF053_18625 [Bacteroidia bacterium]|nr:hypothetical protein [Bacteroidia bacterium]